MDHLVKSALASLSTAFQQSPPPPSSSNNTKKTNSSPQTVTDPQVENDLKKARDLASSRTSDNSTAVIEIYSRLAESGNTEAMRNLGLMYLGMPQSDDKEDNIATGIRHLEKAATEKKDAEALEAIKILYACGIYQNNPGILTANDCTSQLVGVDTLAKPAACDEHRFKGVRSQVEEKHLQALKTVSKIVDSKMNAPDKYLFEERLEFFDKKTQVASGSFKYINLWIPPRKEMAGGSTFLEDTVRWTERRSAGDLQSAINEVFINPPVKGCYRGLKGTCYLRLDPAKLNPANIKNPPPNAKPAQAAAVVPVAAPVIQPAVTTVPDLVPAPDGKPAISSINIIAPQKFILNEIFLTSFTTDYRNIIVKKLKLLKEDSKVMQFLNEVNANYLQEELDSLRLFSKLPLKDAEKVAFNRDVVHVPRSLSFNQEDSQTLLKSDGSAIRLGGSGSDYVKEYNQVSILLRTTMFDGEQRTRPYILFISAPALDDTDATDNFSKSALRPEMSTYIAADGTFLADKHKEAVNMLAEHFVMAAKEIKAGRAIVCAFGGGFFLEAIKNNYPAMSKARANIVDALTYIAIQLRKEGIEVAFSDTRGGAGFTSWEIWEAVNKKLEQQILPVNKGNSALGQGWPKDTDIIMVAGDPDSLIGNGMEKDNSFDGHFGRRSTSNYVHGIAVRAYQNRMEVPQIN